MGIPSLRRSLSAIAEDDDQDEVLNNFKADDTCRERTAKADCSLIKQVRCIVARECRCAMAIFLVELGCYCKHHIERAKPCPAGAPKTSRFTLGICFSHRCFVYEGEHDAACVEVYIKQAIHDLDGWQSGDAAVQLV